MGLLSNFKITLFCILLDLPFKVESFVLESLDSENLLKPNISTNDISRQKRNTNLTESEHSTTHDFGCSKSITISSNGRSCQIQGNVFGTYELTSTMIMEWPTWKMSYKRFLFRCPCAHGRDWLFGKSNGADVGWIKHRNCTGCPESCSQDWMYWDDDVKQWYYDESIQVTTDGSTKTCWYGLYPTYWDHKESKIEDDNHERLH